MQQDPVKSPWPLQSGQMFSQYFPQNPGMQSHLFPIKVPCSLQFKASTGQFLQEQ